MTVNKGRGGAGKTMQRTVLRMSLIASVIIICVAALTVPFVFESQTLWYKAGMDKTVLRAGQLVGLLALLCLLVQIFLGTRGKILEEAFGVASLVAWHKANGVLLCCFAALHIILVLVPEGVANLPTGVKNWPEMVGGVLFLVVLAQTVSSLFRQKFAFDYKQWRTVHRTLGYLALCLVALHVLYVADSFAEGVPRIVLLVMLVMVSVLVLVAKMRKK